MRIGLQEGSLVVAIASATSGMVGVGFSLWANQRNRLDATGRDRIASIRDRRSYGSEFKSWADDVVLAMSQALHLWCSGSEIKLDLLTSLSALLNRGRLFFINEGQRGDTETHEFPGSRPRMLDCIYYTYKMLHLDRSDRDPEQDWPVLFQLQARFIKDCQIVLALEKPNATMDELFLTLRSPELLDTSQSYPAIRLAKKETETYPMAAQWTWSSHLDRCETLDPDI